MPRKGENIYKRKDGRWEGRYIKGERNGKTLYGYVYASTYRETKQRLRQAAAEWENTALVTGSVLCTVADAALRWMGTLEHRVKESTLVKYYGILNNHLLPALGAIPLEQMTQRRIEDYIGHLMQCGGRNNTPLSPRTVSDIMSVLRSILRFAVRDGANVPCDGSSIHIHRDATVINVLSRKDQEVLSTYLFNNISPPNVGLLLSLYAGLRVGEVCGLRWEDIDIEEGVIHVRRTMQRIRNLEDSTPRTKVVVTPPKSASSLRTIPLPAEVLHQVAALSAERQGWFLTDCEEHMMEPRAMQNHLRRVLMLNNLQQVNYHTLRHTFATRCVELGFDPKTLSELLGHSTVAMTDR